MKTQRRKVGVAGGLINQMMGNNSSTPKVGEGATILKYSDREAYEVIEVSEDGNRCVIRPMDCKFVGSCYGDERYTYSSNEDNYSSTLEWSDKKKCWGIISYSTEIIQSLVSRLVKEYGSNWYNHLGVPYSDIIEDDDESCFAKYKLVKGITKEYKSFHKVSIIFGVMEEYRDPSF